MMNDRVISFLQEWYMAQCNGVWEHERGVTIRSLDNPGWHVEIDVSGTPLAHFDLIPVEVERDESNWIRCTKDSTGKFIGAGGPKNLAEILEVFVDWTSSGRRSMPRP